MNFYTHFSRKGKFVLERGYEDGVRYQRRVEYKPTLYVPSKTETEFKTLHGESVSPIVFGDMNEATDFVKQYETVDNFKIYGTTNYHYAYINEKFSDVEYDATTIRVLNIDIEVGSENGFPEPTKASEPITAITMLSGGEFYVFGCGEYTNTRKDVTYVQCRDENQLIMKFLDTWEQIDADVITGWNVQFFDIPYLHNRINRLMGENTAKRLSPWRMIGERTTNIQGKQQTVFDLVGTVILDYLELYKKFTYSQQENYRLDTIANVELGDSKLDYSEYENLHQLYRLDFQKFITYNIKDVEIVDRLDDKMKLIEMVYALAYDAKVNLNDVFAQVRMWDTLTHNALFRKNIVVPQRKHQSKTDAYEGAYVKEPKPGMYDYVASFDLNSLYPHLIMQYNVSPETIVDGLHTQVTIDNLLNSEFENNTEYCMAANGHYFNKDKQGFLPEMMQTMYDDRSKYKKLMIEWQKKKEIAKTDAEKFECEKKISKYKNLQMAKKVQLNSAYGAIGNAFFRFYDLRMAEAITLSGQLSIRWIEMKMNAYMNKILKTENVDYIIASDTDSIYLHLGPLVDKIYGSNAKTMDQVQIIDFMDKVCDGKIQAQIDKAYDELAEYMNAYDQKMQMKREVLADKGVWAAKKRYILNVYDSEGVRYAEPKLKIMGLEVVKSSTPGVCRKKMKEAISIIMKGTESEFQEFNAKFREEFKKLPFEDVAFPRGVSDLTKYKSKMNLYEKGTPIHVRGAIIYNHLLKKHNLTKKYQTIKDGEKIKFSYMKTPNPIQENVISILSILPKEFDLDRFIDYDMQFEKSYLEPLQGIVSSFGWNAEYKPSLLGFFT